MREGGDGERGERWEGGKDGWRREEEARRKGKGMEGRNVTKWHKGKEQENGAWERSEGIKRGKGARVRSERKEHVREEIVIDC